MEKPTFNLICPVCKKEFTIHLSKAVFSTFRVKCPMCGKTIQLHTIKGFKQVRLGRPNREQLRRHFRNGESPSRN